MKPDNTCGSCPVQLAAFERDGLDDWDVIFEACRARGCIYAPTEDFILCSNCIYQEDCERRNSSDGCYLGEGI